MSGDTRDNTTIYINPPTQEASRLWAKTLELAKVFGTDDRWSLIGGLMVQLHAFERGSGSRPTSDIDLLGDSRRRPPMTAQIAKVLVEQGGRNGNATGRRGRPRLQVRDRRGDRRDPGLRGRSERHRKTLGKHTTIQVPGGTQALRRAEIVRVSLGGNSPVELRRPNLLPRRDPHQGSRRRRAARQVRVRPPRSDPPSEPRR